MSNDNGVSDKTLQFLCDCSSRRCVTQPDLCGLSIPFRRTKFPLYIRMVAIQVRLSSITDGSYFKDARATFCLLPLTGIHLKVKGNNDRESIVLMMAQRWDYIPITGIECASFIYFLA